MIAAGLEVEAQSVNEQLFSDWLENNIQQVEAALASGSLRDAKTYLDTCREALKICGRRNPIMSVFHRVVQVLDTQVEQIIALQSGVVQKSTLDLRYKAQLQAQLSMQAKRQGRTLSLVDREIQRPGRMGSSMRRMTSETDSEEYSFSIERATGHE